MDPQVFHSFIKTATALQAGDPDVPPGYEETRAAVLNKYAVSQEWVHKMVSSGAKKAPLKRLKKFVNNQQKIVDGSRFDGNYLRIHDYDNRRTAKHIGSKVLEDRTKFRRAALRVAERAVDTGKAVGVIGAGSYLGNRLANKEKKADTLGRHISEVANLGVLAAPSVTEMATHKPVSERTKNVTEVVGLGGLAAPYLHDMAMRNQAYAGSAMGRGMTRVFGHVHV